MSALRGNRTVPKVKESKIRKVLGKLGPIRKDFLHIKLFRGIEEGDIPAVQNAFKKGADPNARSVFGETVLQKALENLIIPRLKFLKSSSKKKIASKEQAEEILKIVLNQPGLDVSIVGEGLGRSDYTYLQMATIKGDIPLIKKLISLGARVNESSANNRTALYFAISLKRGDLVSVLIRSGASLESPSHESYLHVAVSSQYLKMVDILLNHGVPLNLQNKEGKTPLDIAQGRIREKLARHGAFTSKELRSDSER